MQVCVCMYVYIYLPLFFHRLPTYPNSIQLFAFSNPKSHVISLMNSPGYVLEEYGHFLG